MEFPVQTVCPLHDDLKKKGNGSLGSYGRCLPYLVAHNSLNKLPFFFFSRISFFQPSLLVEKKKKIGLTLINYSDHDHSLICKLVPKKQRGPIFLFHIKVH